MATPGAALELAMQTLLDGENPMVKFNGTSGKWCCLLCKRQFPTDKQLGQHCQASQLHKTNVAEAEASGRIRGPATTSPLAPLEESRAAAKRPLPEEDAPRPAKASRWGDPPAEPDQSEPSSSAEAGGSASQGRMSALEQMELFEKRLKVQEKRKPEKEKGADEETEIDSNRARTINNQMDWECGECGQFNFARTVICHSCKRHVDANTKYLTNRLKEMKCAPSSREPRASPHGPRHTPSQRTVAMSNLTLLVTRRYERFAKVFGNDASRAGVPTSGGGGGQRADGSAVQQGDRARFQS